MDEENLPGDLALRQPPHLPFPNHWNDLVTLDCSPGSVEGPEALLGVDAPFHGPVVLLNDIVQVRTGATPAPTLQLPLLLQFRDHLRVRWIAVDIDDSGKRTIRRSQGLTEESLGGSCIHADLAFRRHLFQIAVGEGVTETSSALPPVRITLRATCGRTSRELSVETKSFVSQALSAPTVKGFRGPLLRLFRHGRCTLNKAASRSAVPSAWVTIALAIQPCRFSTITYPR